MLRMQPIFTPTSRLITIYRETCDGQSGYRVKVELRLPSSNSKPNSGQKVQLIGGGIGNEGRVAL